MGLKILLDTNFLLVPFKFKVDVFSELKNLFGPNVEPLVLSTVLDELSKLGKKGQAAKKLAESRAKKVAWKTPGDRGLEEYAEKHDCFVATNDYELRKKLRHKKIPVVFLRNKKKLATLGAL